MARRLLLILGSLDMGGTQRHVIDLATALTRAGWMVTVYCMVHEGVLAGELRARGVTVHAPWLQGTAPKLVQYLPGRILRLMLASIGLMSELLFRRPTIVHFFLPENYVIGGFCAIAARCRYMIMSRRSLNLYQVRRPALPAAERFLHRHMARVVGNSQAVLAELRTEGVPEEKLRLIYNGVHSAPFASTPTKQEVRQQLGIPRDAWVTILVANIIPYKGHADLLDALSRIKDRLPNPWRLLCVGNDYGPETELRTYASRLELDKNILWLGPRTDVAKLYAAADLGLLVSHEEGFSNVILEGMASALPMVVTNVGGNAEAVLDGETGLVVPAHDPERLGAAILALASDPVRAAAFGKAGRWRVQQHFELDACVRQYEALYAELLPAEAYAVEQH